jgi:tRNA G10  N-methylase Trm11
MRLRRKLAGLLRAFEVEKRLFQADATDSRAMVQGLAGTVVDIVLTDVPYGQRSEWRGGDNSVVLADGLLEPMLDALCGVLTVRAVVAVIANKGQKVAHEGYHRLERFRLGKRQVVLLAPI